VVALHTLCHMSQHVECVITPDAVVTQVVRDVV
jgi:hypothetical protein